MNQENPTDTATEDMGGAHTLGIREKPQPAAEAAPRGPLTFRDINAESDPALGFTDATRTEENK